MVLIMTLASYHPSGAYNFEQALRFLENLRNSLALWSQDYKKQHAQRASCGGVLRTTHLKPFLGQCF